MSSIKILAVLIFCSLPAWSQEKPKFTKMDWIALAADASSRAFDTYSTHQAIRNGYREIVISPKIADHSASMAAYSGAVVAGNALIARYLIRHNQRSMARMLLMADFTQDFPWAVHNLYLKPKH